MTTPPPGPANPAGGSPLTAHRIVVTAAAFFAFSALVVLRQIDALLRGMHPTGGGSYGMNKLVQLFPHGPGAQSVVSTWHRTDPANLVTGPDTLAYVFAPVDTFVFVPAYAILLVAIARRVRTALGASAEQAARRTALTLTIRAFVPLLVIWDVGENISQFALVSNDGKSGLAAFVGSACWVLKWFTFLLVLLIIVAGAVAALHARRWLPLHRRQLVMCRLNVLLSLFLLLVFFGPATLSDQAADVIRRLADDWPPIVGFMAVLLLLAFVMLASSSWLIANSDTLHRLRTKREHWTAVLVIVASAGIFVLFLLLIVFDVLAGGRGVLVAAGIALAVGVSSFLPITGKPEPPDDAGEATFIPALLGALPLAGTGLAMLGTAVGGLLSSNESSVTLVVVGGLIAVSGFAFYAAARYFLTPAFDRAFENASLRRFGALGAAAFALAFVINLGAWLDPWLLGQVVDGTIGVVLLFCLSGVLLAFVLVGLADVVPPPPAVAFLGMRRIPVVLLILLWFVLSSYLDPIGFHSIRTIPGSSGNPETIDQAFVRWTQPISQTSAPASTATPPRRKAVPLVFVSAVGGGVRAAYWTALVLGCLVEKAHPCEDSGGAGVPRRDLFAASGASGGSLGLVTYSAQRRNVSVYPGSPADYLHDDYLAATMARMLFVDFPNSFLRFQRFDDRAAVLEKGWERSWNKRGTPNPLKQGLFAGGKDWPVLLLNGTSVIDGCRFESSSVETSSRIRGDIQPNQLVDGCLSLRRYEDPGSELYDLPAQRIWPLSGTKDLSSYLCPSQDVRLSTAALLSARFPFVSPSGRVRCENGPSAYVVDGGYWDNTASGTIIELYDHLLPKIADFNRGSSRFCVVPFLIQIDNHYQSAAGPGKEARPKELFVPTETLGNVRAGREADTREEAALLFSSPEFAPGQIANLPGEAQDRQAHIYPQAHPGIQAPLGWTLSKSAQIDLQRQLTTKITNAEIDKVRSWFGPGLTCTINSRR